MAIADKIDQQIIALLRENARRSYEDIGKRVSLSAPAVKRRVDRLEVEGVIRGYTATVEPTAFGWHSHAFVELFCEGRISGAEVSAAAVGSGLEAAVPTAEGARRGGRGPRRGPRRRDPTRCGAASAPGRRQAA